MKRREGLWKKEDETLDGLEHFESNATEHGNREHPG